MAVDSPRNTDIDEAPAARARRPWAVLNDDSLPFDRHEELLVDVGLMTAGN